MTALPDSGRLVDVLIPTYERAAGLAVALTGLAVQTLPDFRVVVSDQSDSGDATAAPEVQTPVRLLRARGRPVELHRHVPRRGLAEHRDFLLDQARAPYALMLDDDVLLEPGVLARLLRVVREQGCGMVGAAMTGLSYLDDERPHQQLLERWSGPVRPEQFGAADPQWQRYQLHNAANVWHVQERLAADDLDPVLYKVAWVAGCVLYDVAKLRDVGGFGFWRDLPTAHSGEDIVAQQRVIARYGGCGVLPSGAYHQELPTTVVDRTVDAPRVLGVL